MKQVIYVLSGLGADERAFSRMDWGDLEVHYIPWLSVKRGDDFQEYVQRLAAFITDEKFILLGLSFGGMMAQEVAKLKKPEKLILLSSFKGHWEFPCYYRMALAMKLDRLCHPHLLKKLGRLAQWFFGTKLKKEDGKMLKRIMDETDPHFIAWALNQIGNWKGNKTIPSISIHGNHDRLIPIQYVQTDYIIQAGGHFMVWNQAEEISRLIKKILSTR